ncbi:hypothetical protein RSOLAG1IB_03978 [Rhizoctonia solani AG-1 IB]|nr:hypothetical protein RSOLAG1IB_03978 [Rhizoctonia solani AG-1 IB]
MDGSCLALAQQLDSNGYPTRALYYLHQRLLQLALRQEFYPTQFWYSRSHHIDLLHSLSPEYEEMMVSNDSLEEDVFREVNLPLEDDATLHNLCATLFSEEYIAPPTPPAGGTPCSTPPKFVGSLPAIHSEYACRAARVLTSQSGDPMEIYDQISEGIDSEADLVYGDAWYGGYPCDKSGKRMSLLEEMNIAASKALKETRQAPREGEESVKRH